jgi:hypothetical protein
MNIKQHLRMISLALVALGGCAAEATTQDANLMEAPMRESVDVSAISITLTCTNGVGSRDAEELTMITSASAEDGKPNGVELELRNPSDNTNHDLFVYYTNKKFGAGKTATYTLRDLGARDPKAPHARTVVVIEGLDSGNLRNVSVTHTNQDTGKRFSFARGHCTAAH